MNEAQRANFICAHTRILPAPLTPEILLHQADDSTALWQKTENELGRIHLPPPFWAFPWAGGQALARYVLDHPHWVAGKRVLDFATGSGLVGIAAAMAGAAEVAVNDIDPLALTAARLNAELNRVTLALLEGDIVGSVGDWDIVLAGDISYERDTAARVADWMEELARRGVNGLIGDPGRTYLPRGRLVELAQYGVPVIRDLEDCELKQAAVFRFRP